MDTKGSWFDKILIQKSFYIIITILFIGTFSFIFFKWHHIIYLFDTDYVVDNELLGTFGDFVGGVLGTIFALLSILIMIRTFNQQRKVTLKNIEQAESQRFNDLFFELLNLYQTEINGLCSTLFLDGKLIQSIDYKNKDFFDLKKIELQNKFNPSTSYYKNVRIALNEYMYFYIENKTKVAACYRTLYRIYDLIDNSQLDEFNKKNYLKIIRAQLTESELFFIRYNCLTYYGENFIDYVNKYNVLKHLPLFDLLEFKDWWQDLNEVERIGINIVFHHCTRTFRKILLKKESIVAFNPNETGKYKLVINTKLDYNAKIKLIIDNNKPNNCKEYNGFEKFDFQKLQALLDCYLKEIFIHYNFMRYNNVNELVFYSPTITKLDNSLVIIKSGVRNLNKRPLILSDNNINQ